MGRASICQRKCLAFPNQQAGRKTGAARSIPSRPAFFIPFLQTVYFIIKQIVAEMQKKKA
jgi:hypothetical protein